MRATRGQPEARDDLVHNEDDAVSRGDLPQVVQELRVLQRKCAIVRPVALDDEGGDVVVLGQDSLHFRAVGWGDDHAIQGGLENPAK